MNRKFKIAAMVLGIIGLALAQDDSDLKISGWGSLYFGRVGSGQSQRSTTEPDVDFTGKWLSDFQAGVKLVREFDEVTHVRLHVGMSTAFQVYDAGMQGQGSNQEYSQRKFVAYILEGAIDHTIPLSDAMSLLLEFGYLPVRYNPQAVNLGEYLIRSTPYPTVIESGFEQADKVKVAGIHAGLTINYGDKSTLKFDSYTHSSVHTIPAFDISQVLLATLNHEKIIELGVGTELHNLISVDKKVTIPGKNPAATDKDRLVYIPVAQRSLADSLKDTLFYTTAGTKLMGRVTFNPITLIMGDENDLFGPEDMKIYAEAAIIGWENQDGWYGNRSERMPMMFGINLPAMQLLDVVALQFQYHKARYWNTYENFYKSSHMVPYYGVRQSRTKFEEFDTSTALHLTEDDWKWSLYMSKVVNKRMKFSLQFANDNLFKTGFMPPPPTIKKYTEVMHKTWYTDDSGKEKWGMINDWYWMGRVTFFL